MIDFFRSPLKSQLGAITTIGLRRKATATLLSACSSTRSLCLGPLDEMTVRFLFDFPTHGLSAGRPLR